MTPEIIGLCAVAFGVCGYLPYFYSIFCRETKPHVFTWLIWGILGAIAWAAQFHENAGPGMWAMGLSTLASFSVALLALFIGEKHITRSDWFIFLTALTAIPLWYFTSDPLWSVILICLIDIAAFIPTFRKSWNKPGEEAITTYILAAFSMVFGIIAIENLNLITLLYPACLATMNAIFVILVMARRNILKNRP